MRKERLRLVSFWFALLIPTLLFAQAQTTGRVALEVVDAEGHPIAGARVSFVSPSLQGDRIFHTSENGKLLAAVLPVGPYSVEVGAPGMQPVTVSFRLGVGETVPLSIVLEKGKEFVEEVKVYSTASPLETTALAINFDYPEQVEELPILDRRVPFVAQYAPNITFGPTGFAIAISGAPSYDTVVLLDGAEVSDPWFGGAPTLYLEDAVEEVQVMTAGISARYGRFQGGVVNAITKTGGNTFNGAVRIELSKQSWNSKTPFGEDQSDELREIYQATLGGYVLKDHLWFFAGGRTIPDRETSRTTVVTGETFTETYKEDRWQLKLRGAVTPNHVIEINHLEYDGLETDRSGFPPGNLLVPATGVREDPRTIDGLTYQGVLTSRLFLDLQVTRKEVERAIGGDPAGFDPVVDSASSVFFNNHWFDATDPQITDNETLGVNLIQALSTANWGSHTLEYGVQVVRSVTGGENRQSATGLNLVSNPLDPTTPTYADRRPDGLDVFNILNYYSGGQQLTYRWKALPLGGDQSIQNLALYAQDTWEVGKWRFDAGLRWETYDGGGLLSDRQLDFDAIAPRLGVAYNIDARWQTQAYWGRYIGRFNDGWANEATGVSGAPRLEQLYDGDNCWADPALNVGNTLSDGVTPIDPGADGCDAYDIAAILRDEDSWGAYTDVVDPDQLSSFLADDVEAPHADDFNMAVKYALPRNSGSLSLTYVHRNYDDLVDDFVGLACSDFGLTYGGGECSDTSDIVDPSNATLATVDTVVWTNTPLAKRDYDAFVVTADWRPSARWSLGGNYTWSQIEGNYEGEVFAQPASGSPIGDHVRGRPEEAAVPTGRLDEDIRHRLNVWGTYRFNFTRAGSLVLGGLLTFQSGQVWDKVAAVPRTDVPEYATQGRIYTRYFDGRGNNRFDDWWSLDLSTRYQFPIYKRLDGWVKVSVANVLNNDTLFRYQTTGVADLSSGSPEWQPAGNCGLDDPPSTSCTGFGRIRNEEDYQTPRSYLLTLGLRF